MIKTKNSKRKKKKNSIQDKPIYIGGGILDQANNIKQYTSPITKKDVIAFINECADEFEKEYPYSCIPDKLRKFSNDLFR